MAVAALGITLVPACTRERIVGVEISSVDVVPPSANPIEGQRVQLFATVRGDRGEPLDGVDVAWVSDDTAVASVDADGWVEARAVGSAVVRAVYQDAAGSSDIQVLPLPSSPGGMRLTETDGGTSASESGGQDTFSAVLTTAPGSNVVLDVASLDPGEVEVSPVTLTFTPETWDVSQTVTVTAVDDDADDGDRTTIVKVSVNPAASDDRFDSASDQVLVVLSVDDDDPPPPPPPAGLRLTETGGSTSVSEGGGQDTFSAVLTAAPTSNVVLDVLSTDPGEAAVSPVTLTFTPSTWDAPQTVTVTGVDDADDDGNQSTIVRVSVNAAASDDRFDDASDQVLVVLTIDDDDASPPPLPPGDVTVAETGGGTAVNESGGQDTFTAVLTTEPSADVVLDVVSAAPGEVSVSPAAITFTPATWNVPQTVTVTAVDDDLDDGDRTTIVKVSVNDAASDDRFDDATDRLVVVLTVDDDEPPPPPPPAGLRLTETGGGTAVSESGGQDTFTVELTSAPSSNVVLDVVSNDPGEVTVSPSTLTFTPSTWSAPQTVTVTGVDDTEDDGDRTTVVRVSVNDGASDDRFDGAPDQVLVALTTDDDDPPPPPPPPPTPGITVTQTGGGSFVSEGGSSDTLRVVLAAAPSSNVVLQVRSANTAEVTVAPATLTFTSTNWNASRLVVLTGVDEPLLPVSDGDQVVTVTLSVIDAQSDAAYRGLSAQVQVTNVDNDDLLPGE